MPDDMSFFREQMFKNAAVNGAVAQDRMLTPDKMAEGGKVAAANAALEKMLVAAEANGDVSRKDPVFLVLINFFVSKANTQDGRERALSLAVSVTKRLHSAFDFTPKVKDGQK